jgi:hypothetical protein
MLTDDDRKNAIIASVAVLALVVVCVATIGFYKSVVAEHVDRNTINITEESYEQALAKWQAQHITDYEITVATGQSEATLRVTGGGANIDVIKQSYAGSEASLSSAPGELDELRQMTVERLFQLSRDALDDMESGAGPSRSEDGAFDYFYDYDIHLDGTHGYPRYFAEYQRVTKPSREITWRGALQPAIEVKDFKSLR